MPKPGIVVVPHTVHPRAGGEHDDTVLFRAIGDRHRFIPARAGNTRYGVRDRGGHPAAVHPRAGGEHSSTMLSIFDSVHRSLSSRTCNRFIPARAGNTCRRLAESSSPSVHPRAGGEHAPRNICPIHSNGSSPRGRGTHRDGHRCDPVRRFIPARAGNTCSRRDRPTPRPVHPRAGGEHMT